MPEVRITAEPRTEFGKGAARRTRRAGKVPAVLYGHGEAPLHISLPGHDLMRALRTSNVLLSLDVEGKSRLALPKDVQRDPIRGVLEHVDLLLVRRGEKVTVEVPIHVVGEVAPGGFLTQSLTALTIEAEATRIPRSFEISVEGLEIGDGIKAGDIALPAGATLVTDAEHGVVHVVTAPTAEQLEAEGEGVVPEAEEVAEEAVEGEAPPAPVPAPEES
ncbi:MAG TPA: 50S ribosomal protein L25/general stress protein Ctc [Actinomycetes bacterium]